MPAPKRQNRYNRGQQQQSKMARDIDALSEYDDFCNRVLPRLRQLIADDKSDAKDILASQEKLMAARMVTIALTEKDSKVAMQAIKDIYDRTMGKAKETIDVNNRYEQLSEEDLDAALEFHPVVLEKKDETLQ
jgi:hypothetical protein